ncbi:MAG: methyltransferase domain-containing protein [Planctomycetota bacterium]|jgi:ubiquinone/menaquinone biosynthesis C-methylase UbiE
MESGVEQHYSQTDLGASILDALAADGKSLGSLTIADLAPVDEFHIRGRESTLELAALAALSANERVIDIGCGIGGSARHLAHEHGCSITGIDLTEVYCNVATMLSGLVGLGERTEFRQASALAMPFSDDTFDCAWTEHVQMNIADKRGFYAEIARVLRPGGRLVFHDIFAGPGGEPQFPVPWAQVPEQSSLIALEELRSLLDSLGYTVNEWRDKTDEARAWVEQMTQRTHRPQTSIGLLMGSTAPDKISNLRRNLQEGRVTVLQCVAGRV